MKIKLDNDARVLRAFPTDAGLDLCARETKVVKARDNAIFDTGVHIAIPQGYAGFIKSKSGLNVKHDITSDGVIDYGYTGSIKVKLYNNGTTDYEVKKGDKISQLVILPILIPELEFVDELDEGERGDNGFGSTGR